MKAESLILSVVIAAMLVMTGSGDDGDIVKIDKSDWMEAASRNDRLLVVFYEPSGCDQCEAMLGVVTSLIGDQDMDDGIQLAKSSDSNLAVHLHITTFPTVVFLREKSYLFYDGKPSVDSLLEWLQLSRSKVTKTLYDDSFEHLTQASTGATTGDWLVAFYQESCADILPLMETVAVRIHQKTNVAVVDSNTNTNLALRFNIQQCPDIRLFRQGKMYHYELPKIDIANLKSFVEVWYKNSKWATVRPPKSSFDLLTEKIADELKAQLEGDNRMLVLAGLVGAGVAFVLVFVCCCRSVVGGNSGKQKVE